MRWRYHLFKKLPSAAITASRRLLNREQAIFHSRTHPYAELPLNHGNLRVLGVVSLSVDK